MSYTNKIEAKVLDLEAQLKKANKQLSVNREMMASFLQLTESTNKNFGAPVIIGILENILKNIMLVNHYCFIVKSEQWNLMLNTENAICLKDFDFENDLIEIFKSQGVDKIKNKKLHFFKTVIPVVQDDQQLAFLFIKDISICIDDCSEEEKIRFLETLLNLTLMSLEHKQLSKKANAKINNEDLILAAEVQAELIPSVFPISKHFEFSGKYIPFDIIGGDYYDLIKIDENNIAFCICDVAGKGVSAGMLMSNFQASLRTLISRDYDLEKLVQALNVKFNNITNQFRYISMFIATYNVHDKKLRYINAGHNHPILKNGDNYFPLTKGCTILGMLNDLGPIELGEKTLEKDALLVMYTDGLSEIENNDGEEFGVENLTKYIQNNHQLGLREFKNKLLKEVNLYKGQNEIFDDVSLLCARFF